MARKRVVPYSDGGGGVKKLKGIAASPGIARGKAIVIGSEDISVPKKGIKESAIPKEIARFEDALTKTRAEILNIRDKVTHEIGKEHGDIFNAHLLVIEDRALIEEVIGRIKKERLACDYILSQVLKKYMELFLKINDEYLRERASDINDVGRRVMRHLVGAQKVPLADLKEKAVIVAYDLSPSDTAVMHRRNVIGFVTDIGGRTSHTAIMAKSLEIPAVVGIEYATQEIQDGDIVIVDGSQGTVIANPSLAEKI